MPTCNCQVHCRGGKNVSTRTYAQHEGFRNQVSNFSSEFEAFMAAASHKVYFITFMSRTFAPIYDVQQKQNPGPSRNNDLDASELFPAQVDDKDKDDNEEPHHVDVVDNQVGFYLSY